MLNGQGSWRHTTLFRYGNSIDQTMNWMGWQVNGAACNGESALYIRIRQYGVEWLIK